VSKAEYDMQKNWKNDDDVFQGEVYKYVARFFITKKEKEQHVLHQKRAIFDVYLRHYFLSLLFTLDNNDVFL
jgi:hypothetical protein